MCHRQEITPIQRSGSGPVKGHKRNLHKSPGFAQEACEEFCLIAESRRFNVVAHNVEATIDRTAVVVLQRIPAAKINQQSIETRNDMAIELSILDAREVGNDHVRLADPAG